MAWCMVPVTPGTESPRHTRFTRSNPVNFPSLMKGDKTTVLALIAAAVILAVVGIKSFLDYKVAELEKIHGARPAEPALAEANAAPAPAAATASNELPPTGDISQVTGAGDQSGDFPVGSIDRLPRDVLPPIPEQLLAEPAPDAAPDQRTNAELDKVRQETAMFQEKLNRIRSGNSGDDGSGPVPPPPIPKPGPGSALGAVGDPSGTPGAGPNASASEIPDQLPLPSPAMPTFGPQGEINGGNEIAKGATGAAPAEGVEKSPQEIEAEVAAMEAQVKRQPALAQVVDYNAEWAILVINSGAESNIAPEMRLAVRRGGEIVGFIKVTQVEANESVAVLMSPNKFSPTARKPKPGDEVIAFNLF
ncbi:MAG: hypothetical protein KDN19_18835 [Verrucomicrobiae bacterium]|nr:hypothetical protein [Verrucomicrobiae bacterium]